MLNTSAKSSPIVEAHKVCRQLSGRELGASQLTDGFLAFLECVVDHQVKRFLIRHSFCLKPHIQNRICEHAQFMFQERQSQLRTVVQVALFEQQVGCVDGPPLNIRSISEHAPEKAS